MNRASKWARELVSCQDESGKWGYFHTLSEPDKNPCTTEQALRRLYILGYTIQDEPIRRAVDYMSACLRGKQELPDRREKLHDWDIFTAMMLSTWIRKFTLTDEIANRVAADWAGIIGQAFSTGQYEHSRYVSAYGNIFGKKPAGGRLVDFVSFYQVSLLAGQLAVKTERAVMEYILNRDTGIYYIYGSRLSQPPAQFSSKESSKFLGAIELLAEYRKSLDLLQFVTQWLEGNRDAEGGWDLGASSNDKVYLPLSDDWRKVETRKSDCTYRVEQLLQRLS